MRYTELYAWIKLIFAIVLIVGVPWFIGVINANYEGDTKKDALYIKSPSRVFSSIGVSILSGWTLGRMEVDISRVTEYKRPYTYRRYYTQPYEPVDRIRREMSYIKDDYS